MDKIQRTVVAFRAVCSVYMQHGCVTVNLLEPPGPVQEVQLSRVGRQQGVAPGFVRRHQLPR